MHRKLMIDQKLLDQLEEALEHGGGEHTLEDVATRIMEGEVQIWAESNAVLITEVLDLPQHRVLHFWLAAGVLEDVVALSHRVMTWGRGQDCTRATLHGRRGWVRALRDEGWNEQGVIMGREL